MVNSASSVMVTKNAYFKKLEHSLTKSGLNKYEREDFLRRYLETVMNIPYLYFDNKVLEIETFDSFKKLYSFKNLDFSIVSLLTRIAYYFIYKFYDLFDVVRSHDLYRDYEIQINRITNTHVLVTVIEKKED